MGCPQTCTGYELRMDLNFDTDGDGRVGGVATSTDPYTNWVPIGVTYAAEFNGNGHIISNLTLNRSVNAGLFSNLGGSGVIRNVGLKYPNVTVGGVAGRNVGPLVGGNSSTIIGSYAAGGTAYAYTFSVAGGLVGTSNGTIRASYSTASVSADGNGGIGGLTGSLTGGSVTASYVAGTVAAGSIIRGAFVGTVQSGANISNSYCDSTVNASLACVGTGPAGGVAQQTTAELSTPVGYTGIYANWNVDVDGDAFPDNPWNFGTTSTRPVLKTPAQRQAAPAIDYDSDDDNLIDIDSPHKLNAIRHDLNGDGLPDAAGNYPAYAGAFPDGDLTTTTPNAPRMGCPATCTGYKLTADLDFAADRATVTTTDAYPNWTPIASYESTLDGKGHTITRLTINGSHANAGLFAALTGDAVIRDLGIIAPNVTSSAPNANAGALVGNNAGLITASYIDGGSVTVTGANPYAGGLAGQNTGTGDLRAVYSTASVTASTTATSTAGGLIGQHTGDLTASYAAGPVTGTTGAVLGGLIGAADTADAAVTASYCDTQATTLTNCIGSAPGGAVAPGKTTSELQTPTDYTGIYESWAITLTPGDDTRYNVWNFGEPTEYPTLYQPADRQITITDTLPPPLPRTIPPEPEKPYNPAHNHPEIYNNAEYEMAATCQTHNEDEDGNPQATKVTFDLGTYTGPILLHLSIWANSRYMAYETQGLTLPTLERTGQTATLRVDTDPAQTRFRLDGRRNGLAANLLLGYANCQTNDP